MPIQESVGFEKYFPLTKGQFSRLAAGEPNEVYSLKNNYRARIACGNLLFRRIVVFPIKIPFYASFNLVLLIIKVGELFFRGFQLYALKKEGCLKFKAVLCQVIDLAMMFVIYPLLKLAEIFKLVIGVLFYPRIHFRNPSGFSIPMQAEYYEKLTFNLSKILLSYQELALEVKASLHEIEQGIKKLGDSLEDPAKKNEFFLLVYQLLLPLRFRINQTKLLNIREEILSFAETNDVQLTIRAIPSDGSSVI